MKKPTVGKIATDLMAKPETGHTVIDQMRENLTNYDADLIARVEQDKKIYPGDFYVVALLRAERLLPNVKRVQFLTRFSAPTPEWDQVVYKYHKKDDKLEWLWVVPARDICEYLTYHQLEVAESERELLKFVLDFNDGTLLRLAKKLNGEADTSPLIV